MLRRRTLLLRGRIAAGLGALTLLGVAACSADPAPAPSPTEEVRVAGSVISTAGSSNEVEVVVPDPVRAAWTALGARGRGLEHVAVQGNGRTTSQPVTLTGDATAQIDALVAAINGLDATEPGRSVLAGLNAVRSPAGSPVWVFSPLLDTREPLDFRTLAFDKAPADAIRAVRRAGELPRLRGREVTFVVTPVAGEQEKLSDLQVGYQRAIWEGVAEAAGAKRVTFFVGAGTVAGAGTIPPVPVPDPDDEIASAEQGRTRTCTLPSPALFLPDQPTLIDKKATLRALERCVGDLDPTTRITVEGHTAGSAGSENAFAKDLSTRRATEVAALLRELDVPAGSIEKVVGYGSSKPLVRPASDPRNRAVVVTFISAR